MKKEKDGGSEGRKERKGKRWKEKTVQRRARRYSPQRMEIQGRHHRLQAGPEQGPDLIDQRHFLGVNFVSYSLSTTAYQDAATASWPPGLWEKGIPSCPRIHQVTQPSLNQSLIQEECQLPNDIVFSHVSPLAQEWNPPVPEPTGGKQSKVYDPLQGAWSVIARQEMDTGMLS